MTVTLRRAVTLAAMLPLVAILVLAATPIVSAGIPVSASLTIIKVTDPASDPQDFDFDLTGAGVPADLDLDTDAGDGSLSNQAIYSLTGAQFGAYTITESATPGWAITVLTCFGDADATIINGVVGLDIDAAESIVCTWTNTKLPTLTVAKVTVPASDPQDFYIDLAGTANTTLDTDPTSLGVPDSEKFDLAASAIGTKTLQETAVSGWSLTDVDCTGDADVQYDNAGATLDIDAGENIVCTFTNTKDSQATVAPTQDQGGASAIPTQAETSTTTPGAESGTPAGLGIALLALVIASGVLLATRPRRSRE